MPHTPDISNANVPNNPTIDPGIILRLPVNSKYVNGQLVTTTNPFSELIKKNRLPENPVSASLLRNEVFNRVDTTGLNGAVIGNLLFRIPAPLQGGVDPRRRNLNPSPQKSSLIPGGVPRASGGSNGLLGNVQFVEKQRVNKAGAVSVKGFGRQTNTNSFFYNEF